MNQPTPDIRDVLARLLKGETLSEAEAGSVFELMLSGGMDEAQIGGMLALIAVRGATVDEIVAGARAMRRHVTPVPIGPLLDAYPLESRPVVIDTCGTGGAPKCFNVSTCAAIVAAAAAPGRVWVAKHGGRSRTGRGSAEVLEKLGVNVAASPEVQARCLAEAGVCFSFAVHHHPAMKYAAGPRRSLGFPTIINLLGPLTNPAGARRQLLGTWSLDAARTLAEALMRLGCDRAMIVTSRDGMDELTTTDLNHLLIVEGGSVRQETLDARELGLSPARADELRVGGLDTAAELFREVLNGAVGTASNLVALNAAGALVVSGDASTMGEGLQLAREALRSGRAGTTFAALVTCSNRPA